MLNWQIIRHPMNWVTVILMVYIASIAAQLVIGHVATRSSE